MTTIGRGALPNPSTIDPNQIDRWIVPATGTQPRKYYKLIQGVWVFQPPEAVFDHTDPVLLSNGDVVSMAEVTEHLITDYSAIISAGL